MSILVSCFEADATPPLGYPLCNGNVPPAIRVIDSLSARGIVLEPEGQSPIVLCVVDWVTVNNESHDLWRKILAEAAGTSVDRVSVHCTHPHDAPGADRVAQRLLDEVGLEKAICDPAFEDRVLEGVAHAVINSRKNSRSVTHLSLGKAKVEKFASSRRLIGPDGKVAQVRYSSCKNEKVRAMEEGLVDPYVRLIGFWEKQRPVAVLSYYASHPQSFYWTGAVSNDTAGLVRGVRDAAVSEALHVYFIGAGGNVAAGKYNDGTPTNRLRLAERLAGGMECAWDNSVKVPLVAADVEWKTQEIAIPPSAALTDSTRLIEIMKDPSSSFYQRSMSASKLAFASRCQAGRMYALACLRLGPARILHTPGELFVEYQIAAQAVRPGEFVAVAAYGDCGPGYIGTQAAYAQGGYECDPCHARVAPEIEAVFKDAITQLLST